MSEAIDFKIRISDLTVRLTGLHQHTLDFCRDYLVESEDFDLWVTATEEDTLAEFARHAEVDSPEYYEKICLYRQIAERLPELDRFVFHGAAVEVQGKAYIFTAPPGTGKSTHVALLKKYFGDAVTIINGDKPILRVGESETEVCPCPWAGKERWQTKRSAPLGGIVLLTRSETNSIRRIAPSEYLEQLILQAFVPEAPDGFLKTLELMDRVSAQVPFYLLECNMSREAAEASYNMMTFEG